MKSVEKKLYQIIKKLKGNVLVIGIEDEKLLNAIGENKEISKCNVLNSVFRKKNENQSKKRKKNFQIKKLRKKFKKKKVDFILCNVEDIYPYLKTFVKDSVYINKGKIYLYGETKQYDLEKYLERYKKYHAKVEQDFLEHTFFITISNEHSKTNWFKDFYFRVCDFFTWIYDVIGEFLIN